MPFSFLTQRLAAQGLSLSGTSNVSLAVRGSISAPVIGGKVTASGARLVDARSGLAVNDIAADIAIAGGVATDPPERHAVDAAAALTASGTVGIDAAKVFRPILP